MSSASGTESHTEDNSGRLVDSAEDKKSILPRKANKVSTKLYVASYNIRTMSTPERLEHLEKELEDIKWDILGLCETTLQEEKSTLLRSGHLLYQNKSDTNLGVGGVGILINKKSYSIGLEMCFSF